MAGNLTSQVRGIARRGDGGGQRRPSPEADRGGQGRDRRAGRHHQLHDRHAGHLRRPGDHGGPRGGSGGQARRPGPRARRGRHLEGPHRQREPAGRQPHHAGARHRRGGHRRHQGRPHPRHHRRCAGRGGRPQGHHQRDDPQPPGDHPQEQRAGLAEDEPGQVQPHAAGAEGSADGGPADPLRAGPGRRRPSTAPSTCWRRRSRRGCRLLAGYAHQARPEAAAEFAVGEGLVGQCALERQKIVLDNVPPDYIRDQLRPRAARPPSTSSCSPSSSRRRCAVSSSWPPSTASTPPTTPSSTSSWRASPSSSTPSRPTPARRTSSPSRSRWPPSSSRRTRSCRRRRRLLAHQNVEVERKNERGGAGPAGPGGEGGPAGPDLQVQVGVPGQHVARAAHAAEQPAHPVRSAVAQRRRAT